MSSIQKMARIIYDDLVKAGSLLEHESILTIEATLDKLGTSDSNKETTEAVPNDTPFGRSERLLYADDPYHPTDVYHENRNGGFQLEGTDKGISVFARMAMAAPSDIPDWFEPVMSSKPDSLPYLFDKFGKDRNHPHKDVFAEFYDNEMQEWDADPKNEIPASLKLEVEEYSQLYQKRQAEIKQWEYKQKQERYFQWRLFYAEKMIEFLNRKP